MGTVCGSSESVSEEITLPMMSERHRSMIKVVQILRHDFREMFGIDTMDEWCIFVDMNLSRRIHAFFAFYPKGDRVLGHHFNLAHSAVISKNGSDLFIGSEDTIVKFGMWDLKTKTELSGYPGSILCLAHYSPLLIAGISDGMIHVIHDTKGELHRTLKGHTQEVTSVGFNKQGNLCVSASKDETLRVWCARSWKSLRVLEGHSGEVRCAMFIGGLIISGSLDLSVRVWDSRTGVEQWKTQGKVIKSGVQHLSVNSDHSLVACMHGSLVVFQWTEMSVVCRIPVCSVVCFHPTHPDILAVGGHYGNEHIRFYHARKGTILASFEGHSLFTRSIAFSKDGSRMVSVSEDKSVRVWDVSHAICV